MGVDDPVKKMQVRERAGAVILPPSQAAAVACPATPRPPLQEPPVVEIEPSPSLTDFTAAKRLADGVAEQRLEEGMLLSWYDRDRDFESPQHASECHEDSAVPGYVDYGIHHGAVLKVDIEQGRFVFYYRDL